MTSKSQSLLTLLHELGPASHEELLIMTGWTQAALKNTLAYLNKTGKMQREGEIFSAHPHPPPPPPRKAYPAQQRDAEHAAWMNNVNRQIAEKRRRQAQENRLCPRRIKPN